MTLARERQNMLLADAEAARLARQARAHRRQHRTPATRRSLLRHTLPWLPPAWSRLLTRRGALSSRAALRNLPAMADREVA
jgi:hypothetical protein